ncbi:hypothetical protein CAPTEDRAFT_228204 [Capitella teleta]|uniref:Cyclic nucleotide-binding domain-containing protein n=1 Tax=Capitella teleta TaxID=283909 RepID=R7VDC2_CAPTE|nr:hypothetical protein CAPTEDRAFT_228204 [Capitella teleta]|eukprot:ELU16634.1 hypothetical protein CAPTEDRAFT_228204 [Capitella teleta]
MLNVFPREIMFHYFKRGTLIEGNSKRSKWIYIIKSGMCRVMTQLREVWPKREWRPAPALSPAPFPRQGTSEQESRLNTGFRRKSVTRAPSPIERARTEYFATLLKEQELFEREQRQKTPKKKEKPKSPSKMKTTESESESETKPAVSLPAISRIEVAKDDEGSDKTAFLPLSEAHFGTQPQPPCSAEANHVTRTSSSNRNTKAEDCFACIGELREGDAFGLQDLQFSKENVEIDETPLEVALVSQGAELIMLSKSFFLKHMDEKYQRDIRNDIQPYPERDILQYNLQTEVNWKLFREDTVQGLVDLRMYAKAPPRSNESLKIQSPCV